MLHAPLEVKVAERIAVRNPEQLLELIIRENELAVLWILEVVRLDVLVQLAGDDRARLARTRRDSEKVAEIGNELGGLGKAAGVALDVRVDITLASSHLLGLEKLVVLLLKRLERVSEILDLLCKVCAGLVDRVQRRRVLNVLDYNGGAINRRVDGNLGWCCDGCSGGGICGGVLLSWCHYIPNVCFNL